MAIAILLQAFATNVWQLFILRAVMGLTSGYIPNAMALVASQVPRERSGWALSTLSTAQIGRMVVRPLLGSSMADTLGLRMVLYVTAALLMVSFLVTLFLNLKKAGGPIFSKADRLSGKALIASLPYPKLMISLFSRRWSFNFVIVPWGQYSRCLSNTFLRKVTISLLSAVLLRQYHRVFQRLFQHRDWAS